MIAEIVTAIVCFFSKNPKIVDYKGNKRVVF